MGAVPNAPAIGKLGKLPPRLDPRTLRLASYLPAAMPPIPPARSWSASVRSWPMLANDICGDCTIASAGHLIQMWTSSHHHAIVPTDADILRAYSSVSGYNSADPSTDQGAVELDVLNYWRRHGIAGHKISAFVAVNPRNRAHVLAAIDLFGGIYAGFALPNSIQSQTGPGKAWTVTQGTDAAPGSLGGHAVPVVDYAPGAFACVTWGAMQRMSDAFAATYMDECYALISEDWVNAHQGAPCGFDLESLQKDLRLVTGNLH